MPTETGAASSLPFEEPSIVTILVQTSFLLLINVINAVVDRLLYCGLLGQILIGIAWGTPGAKLLPHEVEEVIVQLGYLGLILLVYEGGLSTSFQSLKANLLLSSAVALTGISVPIALSFSLQGLLGATPLQAFAAGAALCSTSLGTTFTVLNSSGLGSTRLGVVLTSAAMMDDVVGLVMVQVISNLGGGDIGPITVVRPILVSLAFAVVAPLACRFILKPATILLNSYRERQPTARLNDLLSRHQTAFAIHSLLLIGLVTGATYAGTSNLFAAYIAGATISWWDSEVPHPQPRLKETQATSVKEKSGDVATSAEGHASDEQQPSTPQNDIEIEAHGQPAAVSEVGGDRDRTEEPASSAPQSPTFGAAIYERYYHQAAARILQPFFFAAIGFSIPITRMFSGEVVWKGIIYATLMAIGKLVCGLWLVRLAVTSMPLRGRLSKMKLPVIPHLWGRSTPQETATAPTEGQAQQRQLQGDTAPAPTAQSTAKSPTRTPPKPFSLYPPLIMALAMTARGEIGFLISGVAESNGVFSQGGSSDEESDIFLVVTWAIVICTILGPLGVGLCVRRVKTLEERKNREQEGAGRDVLGEWAVG